MSPQGWWQRLTPAPLVCLVDPAQNGSFDSSAKADLLRRFHRFDDFTARLAIEVFLWEHPPHWERPVKLSISLAEGPGDQPVNCVVKRLCPQDAPQMVDDRHP